MIKIKKVKAFKASDERVFMSACEANYYQKKIDVKAKISKLLDKELFKLTLKVRKICEDAPLRVNFTSDEFIASTIAWKFFSKVGNDGLYDLDDSPDSCIYDLLKLIDKALRDKKFKQFYKDKKIKGYK